MPIVPVAEFAPDQADYLSAALSVAKNTYPRADGSDGPLQGPAQLASALAASCKGVALAASSGTSAVIAGTTTKLYALSGTSWSDVSGGATFAVPTGGEWRFTQFGTRLIATDYADTMRTYTITGGGTFSVLAAAAPRARYIATIEPGFVMVGDFVDVAGSLGSKPNGVWWSGLNDATNWPTPGTSAASAVQSDYNELALGQRVTGILGAVGGANGAVFTERAVYRLSYVGGTIVFDFFPVDQSRGCIAPGSLAQVGPMAYFLAEDGFYAFDGTACAPIGFGKVDKFFARTVDQNNLSAIRATVDPFRRLVVWYALDPAGNPVWFVYSYALNRWRYGYDSKLGVQAFVQRLSPSFDSALTSAAVSAFGWGGFLTQEGSASFVTQESGGGILLGATQPATFLAGVDTSNKLSGWMGETLAATIETGETDAHGRRMFVSGLRPLTDAAAPTCAVGWRNQFSDAVLYTTATQQEVTGICPQRISARYARAQINIPASDPWTYLQGVDVMSRAEGTR